MTKKQKRLGIVVSGLAMLGLAVGLILTALEDSVVFFFSPTQLEEKQIAEGQIIRVGGLVEVGSIDASDTTLIKFVVTDMNKSITVEYPDGILPALFKEKQGVIVEGVLKDKNTFVASKVLAKHDENYMPKEVADTLKEQGHWQEEDQKKTE